MIRTEARVINLERMMSQLIRTVERTSAELREFKDEIRRDTQQFKEEIRRDTQQFKEEVRRDTQRLKNEMSEFKDEMSEFKDEMSEFKDEMGEFKDEMGEFKDKMSKYTEESRREIREMRRQWGELANKMGTMAEDLVAPSIPRVFAQTLGCNRQDIDSAVRVKRNRQGVSKEFDVVAVCGEYVLVNETKSHLTPEAIAKFAQKTLPAIRTFLPEYADKKVVGAIASLYVDESLVRYGEKLGLIVLGFGEDVMDVLNSPNFKPKIW